MSNQFHVILPNHLFKHKLRWLKTYSKDDSPRNLTTTLKAKLQLDCFLKPIRYGYANEQALKAKPHNKYLLVLTKRKADWFVLKCKVDHRHAQPYNDNNLMKF